MTQKLNHAQRPKRLLNPDGTMNVIKKGINQRPQSNWRDIQGIYLWLAEMKLRTLAGYSIVVFVVINALFATIYLLCKDGLRSDAQLAIHDNTFEQALFFSFETFSTVGYGHIFPTTWVTNAIASLESYIGLTYFAINTALVFYKFSLPHAKIEFSKNAIFDYTQGNEGQTAFKFRIMNQHTDHARLMDIEVELMLVKWKEAENGELKFEYVYPLKVKQSKTTILTTAFKIIHPIDEDSPFKGKTKVELEAEQIEILANVKGYADAYKQYLVFEKSFTLGEEIHWGYRFEKLHHRSENGKILIDLQDFHRINAHGSFPEKL